MKSQAGVRRLVGGTAALAIVVLAIAGYAARASLLRTGISLAAMAVGHVRLSERDLTATRDRAIFTDLRVTSLGGEEIARVDRLDVRYDLHDLITGSGRAFGLKAIDAERPAIVIVRHPDGSFNVPNLKLPQSNGKAGPPAIFDGRIANGSVEIYDQGRVDPHQRRLYVRNVNGVAHIDTTARSTYDVSMQYGERLERLYPIHGTADVDPARGYAMQRWTAPELPVAGAIDFAVNSPSLHVAAGTLRGLDARYFGFRNAEGRFVSHLSATAYLDGARVAIGGLKKPVRDVSGRIDVYDDGLMTRDAVASIGGIPAHVTGGILNLTAPEFRIAVRGSGDLARLRGAFAQTAALPISGPLDFAILVEGGISHPLEWISLRSGRIAYRQAIFSDTSGTIAFDGSEADVLGLQTRYGSGVDAGLQGRVTTHARPGGIAMFVHASAPARAVPYANALLPGFAFDGVALATADDPKAIDLRGALFGSSASQQLDATFNVASSGTGSVGPIWLGNQTGSLYARIALDHPHDDSGAVLDARNYAISTARTRLDATLVGSEWQRQVAVAGSGELRSPWGTLAASGTFAGDRGALEGRYRGSLDAPSHFGFDVPARGRVDAPVALFYDGGRMLAQIDDARFQNATIEGVPIRNLSATVGGTRSLQSLHVYAARAGVAGGTAVAAGDTGRDRSVAVAANALQLAGGRVSAGAIVGGSPAAPRGRSAFVVRDARFHNAIVSGNGNAALSHGTLTVGDATLQAGPAFVTLAGNVAGALTRTPHVDLDARVRSSDAAGLLALAGTRPPEPIEASVDANLHVAGTAASPQIAGSLDVPEGSINGLAFRDLRANVAGSAANVAIGGGSAIFGSTPVAFGGAMGGGTMRVALSAPRADLADFNDYFDAGDTFAGTGRLALDATIDGGRIASSSGNAAFTNARFRRLELGTVAARWHGAGSSISTSIAFGGPSGSVTVNGSVDPASQALDLRGVARGVDLATWLPMLGYQVPVTGRLDADALVRGRYPDVSMNVRAGVVNGTAGRLPIRRFDLVARARDGRGTIQSAHLEVPYLTTTASGTFGLHPGDSLALLVRSTSPDVGSLAEAATGETYDASGALDSTLRITGTVARPRAGDDFTLSDALVRGVAIPRVSAHVDADRRHIALRNGLVQLHPGSIAFDASTAPLRATIVARGVDAGNFTGLFEKGTHLGGTVDGTVRVGGTRARPQLRGALALANGTFIGPMERAPISHANARLAFEGTRIALSDLHAAVGGGEVAATGSAAVPSFGSLRGLAFSFDAHAENAHVEMPAYFTGNVQGSLAVSSNGGPIDVGGDLAFYSARLPLSAFYNPAAHKTQTTPLPQVAFDRLRVRAGNDVRVQSAEVDVGARGSAVISGTLDKPKLRGAFRSTGGTVGFYRNFALQRGLVSFSGNGIVPYVDATANTFVANPETAIRLHITGPATDMNLALASDPSYDREQILGILLGMQQFGAVRGLQSSGVASGGFSLPGAASNIALGQVDRVFTRRLLEPLSTSLGASMGFTDLQITDDLQSGLGLHAMRAFGKNVNAVLTESMGYPRVQAVALEAHPQKATSLRLRMYSTSGPSLFSTEQIQPIGLDALNLNRMTELATVGGTNGVDFSFVHKFPP